MIYLQLAGFCSFAFEVYALKMETSSIHRLHKITFAIENAFFVRKVKKTVKTVKVYFAC